MGMPGHWLKEVTQQQSAGFLQGWLLFLFFFLGLVPDTGRGTKQSLGFWVGQHHTPLGTQVCLGPVVGVQQTCPDPNLSIHPSTHVRCEKANVHYSQNQSKTKLIQRKNGKKARKKRRCEVRVNGRKVEGRKKEEFL